MIKKIVIDNFMAHVRTELELGPGVTILTGPNNTGKSAIVEALRCVATNPKPRHYIRHGAKEARVTVEMDDGAKVVWIRKKGSSGYELWKPGAEEPEEYWKFGRKPPEDILKVLKLDLVELESGKPIDVHVGNQREPIFLLNQPPSHAAAFFAASTEGAHLLAMQNLLKSQTQDAKRQEREDEERISRIESEMDTLSSLPDIGLQVESARELEGTAKNLQAEIPVLKSLLSGQLELSKSLEVKTSSTAILNATIEPPKLNLIEELNGLIHRLESVNRKQAMATKISTELAPLAAVPDVFDTSSLAGLCSQISSADNSLRKAEVRRTVLTELAKLPTPDNTSQLSDLIDQMIALRYRQSRFDRWDVALQNVAEPPVITSEQGMVRLLADIRGLASRQGEAQTALIDLEKQLQSVKDDLAGCIDKLGCCPTCGADINTEAFIDRGCQHDA